MVEGHHGFNPPGIRPGYKSYQSPHAPPYQMRPNFHGIDQRRATRFGITAGLFAGVLGIAGAFFIADVPRFRMDVMEKIPIIGAYWHKEIPPEDNPF